MDTDKSLDKLLELIAALLTDVHKTHGGVFNAKALRLTLNKVRLRALSEGCGFLTKTLPRLGKALDRALSSSSRLSAIELGFKPQLNSELPMFMGEFFSRVLSNDGTALHAPCADSVGVLRQVLYLLYKYELPNSDRSERIVLERFEKTEQELSDVESYLDVVTSWFDSSRIQPRSIIGSRDYIAVRNARRLLNRVFSTFDPSDIVPRHGPGVVSTKEKLWDKYLWTNISDRIASVYPVDEFFFSSLGHVCDRLDHLRSIRSNESSAKVILVPKDSRGPRLISCEPVDFQWVQQGLGRAIVRHVENHPITRWNVFFTDQGPNQRGALLGSSSGKYATLDLNEASDRVTLGLVRLLFPKRVFDYLDNCRSLSTIMPSGKKIVLKKFAPMGSALCFPILALTTWAILAGSMNDRYSRERVLVYGDDVIVPTANAADAIERLESLGLKVNRDKSCTEGLFRESCGVDAFKGRNVTPVRIRTVLSSSPSPGAYTSWISYANSFYDKRYFTTYDFIVSELHRMYGDIPDQTMHLACPCLREVADTRRPKIKRWNRSLQKVQFRVYDVKSPRITKSIDGWSMLLRYFTEGSKATQSMAQCGDKVLTGFPVSPFSASTYTRRRTSMLVRCWR